MCSASFCFENVGLDVLLELVYGFFLNIENLFYSETNTFYDIYCIQYISIELLVDARQCAKLWRCQVNTERNDSCLHGY